MHCGFLSSFLGFFGNRGIISRTGAEEKDERAVVATQKPSPMDGDDEDATDDPSKLKVAERKHLAADSQLKQALERAVRLQRERKHTTAHTRATRGQPIY